jgi:hypothetical protein
MALTRILNNQVTDSSAGNTYLGINAGSKVQDYSVTAGKLANNLTYASNLTVQGNLDVQGTTTTIDTYNVVIEDPLLLLAKDQSGSPTFDIGYIGERGTSENIAFAWIESADEFATIFTNTAVSNTTVNVVSYANFHTFDANVAGNLTVIGTTNIANISVGNISATGIITATGNITGGNLVTGGQVNATGNVNGAIVNTAQVASTGGITITSGGSSDISLSAGGNINAGSNYINNVSSPQQDNDAASKIYVDNLVATGLNYHEAVQAATTANLAVTTGGTITYNQPNGAGNGIGATITTTGSFNLIDTSNVQTIGTRILVKDEGNAVLNGVYIWSNATVITRSTDADEYGVDSAQALSLGSYFFTEDGNVNKGASYVVAEPAGTITFGTSNIVYDLFSTSQVYSANTLAGLVLNGLVFAAKVDNDTTAFDGGGNIIVKAGANLTTPNIGAATGTSLSVSGNISGGNLNSNGVLTVTSTGTLGNLEVSGTGNIAGKTIIGNALINDANIANAALAVGATTSVLIAVGNTLQRPGTGVTGMIRFNTTTDSLEYYDNDSWTSAGTTFSIVVADSFVGNGTANTFTLSQNATTAATIVSINGIVQIPTTSYSVTGNVLTFTEAPEVSDVIDARLLTTTTTVTALVSGSAIIEGDGANAFVLTGNFLNGNANGAGNIGSPSGYFNTIFATATSAQYADLAEMYEADQIIEPGTVVCFGGAKEVTMCATDGCRRIAGVISTNPSYIMNAGLAGDHIVAVALTGRVPTRVTGTIRKGDMLVATADGRARADANPVTGSIIGKALADFDGADGVIEVVVGRL